MQPKQLQVLQGLLFKHDWQLLGWSNPCLVHLANEEGLGEHSPVILAAGVLLPSSPHWRRACLFLTHVSSQANGFAEP